MYGTIRASFFLILDEELDASYWNNKASKALSAALQAPRNLERAKNLILFLGDGESFFSLFDLLRRTYQFACYSINEVVRSLKNPMISFVLYQSAVLYVIK